MFIFILYFFFFKQKTAYEMRISDWSSDVCSSDLGARDWRAHRLPYWRGSVSVAADFDDVYREQGPDAVRRALDAARWPMADEAPQGATSEADVVKFSATPFTRSEEHTSELQSLMRISYAVFCLKKKKHDNTNHTHDQKQ